MPCYRPIDAKERRDVSISDVVSRRSVAGSAAIDFSSNAVKEDAKKEEKLPVPPRCVVGVDCQ